jgi:hypothetical protein
MDKLEPDEGQIDEVYYLNHNCLDRHLMQQLSCIHEMQI